MKDYQEARGEDLGGLWGQLGWSESQIAVIIAAK